MQQVVLKALEGLTERWQLHILKSSFNCWQEERIDDDPALLLQKDDLMPASVLMYT